MLLRGISNYFNQKGTIMTKVQQFLLYVSDLCKLALSQEDKTVILIWSRLVYSNYLDGKLSDDELIPKFKELMATDKALS